MTKRELQAWLDRSGSTLYRLAKDIRVATSTTARWKQYVPGYAEFYAIAMAVMTEEQREEVRRELARYNARRLAEGRGSPEDFPPEDTSGGR